MKHLNFLSNLLSLSLGSPCTDVSLDRRLTVGSPSGLHRLSQYIAVTLLLLVVGVGNVWGGTATITEDFEKQSAGTTYNSTQTYTAANSNAGIAWTIYYGCV